ncbi:hypothetical protein PUN4_360036 [Paraburkholderia unamae]|nr:hypothetical protein PUN4_360036 [Paraburkholderia unamae]
MKICDSRHNPPAGTAGTILEKSRAREKNGSKTNAIKNFAGAGGLSAVCRLRCGGSTNDPVGPEGPEG